MSKYYLILAIILLMTSCKSDPKEPISEKSMENNTEKIDENLQSLNNIKTAYNISKFKSEDQVKFKLKYTTEDSIFFDGFVTIKTDGSKAKFKDANIDKTLELNDVKTELDKKLSLLTESYAIGFWLDTKNYKQLSESDTLSTSIFTSPYSKTKFTLNFHPVTHIINNLFYESNIKDFPFDKGKLYFRKYITVNRIPVALNWEILSENGNEVSAEISRISYPKVF